MYKKISEHEVYAVTLMAHGKEYVEEFMNKSQADSFIQRNLTDKSIAWIIVDKFIDEIHQMTRGEEVFTKTVKGRVSEEIGKYSPAGFSLED